MTAGIVTLVGCPGSGKTTTASRMLVAERDAGSPIVIFDPTGDLARGMRDLDETIAGDDLAPLPAASAVDEARRRLGAHRMGELPPVIVLYPRDPRTIQKLAGCFLEIAVEMKRDTVYACDEAELLFPSQTHSTDSLGSIRVALLTMSRNKGVRLIVCSKRPQRLHVDARENAAHVLVFRSDSERFNEGCANFGNPEDYERASSLPVGQYIYRAPFDDGDELQVYDGLADPLPFPPLRHQRSR
jgi:DNA helicase HerA-like ATPase